MKAISLTQPWATLIALGHKRIETRSWRDHYRGPLAIHAAKGMGAAAHHFANETFELHKTVHLPRGAVVAVVQLFDIVPTGSMFLEVSDQERRMGDFGPGRWAWLLEDVQPIDPVKWTGQLGLWEWPDDVAEGALSRAKLMEAPWPPRT